MLDSANNAIKYRSTDGTMGTYTVTDMGTTFHGDSISGICQKWFDAAGNLQSVKDAVAKGSVYNTKVVDGKVCMGGLDGSYPWQVTPKFVGDNNYRSIPIDTVADKIYDNAKTGHADSVSVVTTCRC